ncbi:MULTISPECIES: hypothetical protein, partial [Lactobacillus]
WSKDQSSLCKNKKDRKRRSTNSKSRVGLIVFWYLRVSFFPDTFALCFYFITLTIFIKTISLLSLI